MNVCFWNPLSSSQLPQYCVYIWKKDFKENIHQRNITKLWCPLILHWILFLVFPILTFKIFRNWSGMFYFSRTSSFFTFWKAIEWFVGHVCRTAFFSSPLKLSTHFLCSSDFLSLLKIQYWKMKYDTTTCCCLFMSCNISMYVGV